MKSRMFALFIVLMISVSAAKAQSGTIKNGQGPAESAKQASAQPPAKTSDTKQEDCGCEASNTPTDTVGIVNAVKITFKDLDEPMKEQIAALRKQVIDARRRELNLQINSRLLEAEARRQGTTSTKLVEQEIVAKAKEPTEAEVQAFYDQNKERIPGEFKEYKAQIVDYLKAQRQEEAAKKFAEKLRVGAEVKVLDEKVTAPEKPEDRARVFALLNGAKITSGDIEEALQPLIYDVQRKLYELRKGELELRINDVLLEQEAQKRKITTQAVVEAELTPKVKKVSEDDARKFYAENKDRIDGSFDQVKDRLIDYLQKREQRRAELAFVEEMKKGAKVEMSLKEPVSPAYKIATDDQPSKGSADAPVTIVEFTDFECSTCQQSQPMLEKVAQEYSDKVRLVVRDYPLAQHKNAFKAAEAAEAAREQGKYWEYTAVLFANQKELGPEKLKEYASKVGLDRKKFDAELDSSKHADKVQRDMQDGMRVGVNGTPTVFINGRRVSDRTYESLKAAIEEALKQNEAKKDTRRYYCVMDPEVKSNKPGACPKCGMTLRLAKEEAPGDSGANKDANENSDADAIKDFARPGAIPDTPIYDQDGRKLHFYSDLVKGKTVAINFIFTTCTTICPPLAATFRRIQVELGGRVGNDVRLISISVDPATDVPERLKAFAAKFKAGPGWTFVTGSKPDIDLLLKALGASVGDKNDHTPMVLVGNEPAGYWTRSYGLAPPATLVKVITDAASKGGARTTAGDIYLPGGAQPGARSPGSAGIAACHFR